MLRDDESIEADFLARIRLLHELIEDESDVLMVAHTMGVGKFPTRILVSARLDS